MYKIVYPLIWISVSRLWGPSYLGCLPCLNTSVTCVEMKLSSNYSATPHRMTRLIVSLLPTSLCLCTT